MLKLIIASILMFTVSIGFVKASRTERELLSSLFKDYEKLERPVADHNEALNVSIGLSIIQIIDYDDSKETLTSVGWPIIQWNDYNLAWSPSKFGGIETLKFPASKIWLPDIILYNSAGNHFDTRVNDISVVVHHSGQVNYLPPLKFETFCPHRLNEENVIVCSFKFGSWAYEQKQLNVFNEEFKLGDYLFEEKEWKKISSNSSRGSKKYECCPDDYPYVTFDIYLKKVTD